MDPSDAEMDASKEMTTIIRNPIHANSHGPQEKLNTWQGIKRRFGEFATSAAH